jgi:hypothetical protein
MQSDEGSPVTIVVEQSSLGAALGNEAEQVHVVPEFANLGNLERTLASAK